MSVSDAFKVAGALLGSVGGGAVIIFGLSSWLGKVWASRILEEDRKRYGEELTRLKGEMEAANRKLQAELDKSIHVYRVQFEKEFMALIEIWKAASKLRSSIAGLRPSMSLTLPDESKREEELNKRFRSLQETLWQLQRAIHDQGPFYGEEVYDEVDKLLMIAKREKLNMRLSDPKPFSLEWYRDGENNKAEFIAQADVVSKAMRARIARLMVYPERS